MDRIRNKYNPEASELKAQNALTSITKGEFEGWVSHPCTKSLKYTIEAALDNLVLAWAKGGFTDNSSDSTGMMHARSTGQAEALERIMDHIDTMLEITQREDIYEEAIRTP